MPVYNCGKSIHDTLISCLNQDFPYKYEIIIVDDGSTDNTLEIIKSFDDKRIKLYTKSHSGISDALNLGLSKCNGEYICRMDGDDIMYEYRLSYQYAYMLHNPNCDILASNINRYEFLIIMNNIDRSNIILKGRRIYMLSFISFQSTRNITMFSILESKW